MNDKDQRPTPTDDRPEKPMSFDFKLRLGAREAAAEQNSRGTGELVQLQPIDWDSFTGLKDDGVPREYKTDGDLPSLIVELANKIAGPDTLAQRALRMNALASTTDFDAKSGQPVAGDDVTDGVLRPAPAGPPEIPVATVDDDPMLSAVVGRILEPPPPEPAVEVVQVEVVQIEPPTVSPQPVVVPAPVAPASSSLAPVVSAPVEPAPEGPIELPRIVALTPDLPSGEVAQPTNTPPSLPISQPVVAQVPAPVQMLTGVEAMALAATTTPPSAVADQPAPAAPIAPLQLAKIERKPGAERPTKPVDFHALLGQSGLQPTAVKKRKKRHPFRVLFKLIVVLAIIGAGLFFGKKYVLDMRWSGEMKPYADAVASARELKWDKPIEVTTLPIDVYAQHLTTSVLGTQVSESQLSAEWRAMGLLEGELHLDDVAKYSASFRPVVYDPIDHTIYQLENTPTDLRDFNLYQAMTLGLLDQHFGWSTELDTLGRSARNGRVTMVEADASAVAWQIVDPTDSELERLSAHRQDLADDIGVTVGGAIDYPSDLLIGPGAEARNLFTDGVIPDVAARNAMIQTLPASDAAALDGLRQLSAPTRDLGAPESTEGMVFWYYVLAGRLSNTDAWNAAVAWNGDSLVPDTTAGSGCFTATISTVGEPGRVLLLNALQTWAASAPAEARTAVAALGSEQITVNSCDPGPAADTKLDDGIQFWGLADEEYGVLSELSLEFKAAARTCTVNALRNFGVLAQIENGDAVGAKTVTDQILASCAEG